MGKSNNIEKLNIDHNKIENDKYYYFDGIKYKINRLLGKGKGGYSYLVNNGDVYYIMKKIHHEKVDYFHFDDKFKKEIDDYNKLAELGIRVPKLLKIDYSNETIIKEFIDGPTIMELVENRNSVEKYFNEVLNMQKIANDYGYNLDYYPTNFVVSNDLLYYIDYELNANMDEWTFENWGINYWRIDRED